MNREIETHYKAFAVGINANWSMINKAIWDFLRLETADFLNGFKDTCSIIKIKDGGQNGKG